MHTFFINTSKKEFKAYNVLFDIHLENKTLVTMQCPLADWWDGEKGYAACVKTMGEMIDGYAELNNAFNVIIYVDLNENAGYTAIPRDEEHQRERDEYCGALHLLYRYLFVRSITDKLINLGRDPQSVLVMFGEDKRIVRGGLRSDSPNEDNIKKDVFKILGLPESISKPAAGGGKDGTGKADAADEEALYESIAKSRKEKLPAGLNEEFLKELLRAWCQSAANSGEDAANKQLRDVLCVTIKGEARRAHLEFVSCPYDYVAVRTNKSSRAVGLLNIAIHILKCVEDNSIYGAANEDGERAPKDFQVYDEKALGTLLEQRKKIYSDKISEIKGLRQRYSKLKPPLAPSLYKFDSRKFGLNEYGENDPGREGGDAKLLSKVDSNKENYEDFSGLAKDDSAKNGSATGGSASFDPEELKKQAKKLQDEHHNFFNELKHKVASVLSHYAGKSAENRPAMLTTGGYNYTPGGGDRSTEERALESVKGRSQKAYDTIFERYMDFCAGRTVTVTDIDEQYDWFIAKVDKITAALKKLKFAAIGLLVAMVVLYIPFLLIQAGDISQSVVTMAVAAVSVVVPLLLTGVILAFVAAAERKKYGEAWTKFKTKSDEAMAENRRAVQEYNKFLFTVVPELRWVYDYKLDVNFYAECCAAADVKVEHHRCKLAERVRDIENILKDFELDHDILKDLELNHDNGQNMGGNTSGTKNDIDYRVPFCTGKKNIAFYSIITAEELNKLGK